MVEEFKTGTGTGGINENNVVNIESLKTDQEIANFLLTKYPNKIQSIQINDPNKIMFGIVPLSRLATQLNENIKDDNLLFIIKMLINFKTGPVIKDVFENNRNKRIEFIKISTNNFSNPMRKFFDRNQLKYRNLCGVTNKEFYSGYISQELLNETEKLAEIINLTNSPDDRKGYREMSEPEKENVKDDVNILTSKILQEIVLKYNKN